MMSKLQRINVRGGGTSHWGNNEIKGLLRAGEWLKITQKSVEFIGIYEVDAQLSCLSLSPAPSVWPGITMCWMNGFFKK